MTLDAVRLSILRLIVQGGELIRAYWYVAIPAALTVAALLLLRARVWSAASRALYRRGLLVDVSQQRDLIVLIHAARQDPAFRAEVLRLLRLPPHTRRALLEQKLADMRAHGESESFIEAIGLLRDDYVVARTKRLLLEEP